MIAKIKNRINSIALKKSLSNNVDISHAILSPIALFCMPRGGSTWLMEILQEYLNTAVLWEPLFRGKYNTSGAIPTYTRTGLEEIKKFRFWYYEYIEKDEQRPEVKDFFKRLFTGQVGDKSILFKNSVADIKNADRLLFKFCYANLMLPYLDAHFDLKSIVLHRHPCAVVASMINHKGGWLQPEKLINFNIPEVTNNNIFTKYNSILKSVSTVQESLAALWCLNFLVANSVKSDNVIKVHYEELLLQPKDTIKSIAKHIGTELPYDKILQKTSQPSQTSNSKSAIMPEQQIKRWKTALSPKQITQVLQIVDRFGIKEYNEEFIPKREA